MSARLISSFSLVAMLATLLMPTVSHAAVTGAFSAGELIRGEHSSTVYYFGPDGRRYVFPNEKTYFTWYKDFSTVKTITDGQLGTIPLGMTNVTYRPGYKMIKITTDPKTYVIDQGGFLRWVGSEQLAKTLYGISWQDRIDDVPDAFYTNYHVGTPIQTESDYHPNDVLNQTSTIAMDKQFAEKTLTVTIGNMNNAFVPSSTTIKVGTTVTWTNGDIVQHTVASKNFNSNFIDPGKTYTYKFNTAGSFDYHCGLHPVMQGTINVVN